MHNAWNDHEGWRKSYFWMIPLIDANAPIWCLLLPHECESLAFFPIFTRFPPVFLAQLKISNVSFKQLHIEMRNPTMQKPGEILEQIQRIANDMQNKVGDAIRNSPAQEIEKNVRAMMSQGFQKMDLVTRDEFELQSKVLAKTREKLEALEAKVAALEKAS
jgi:BMFP domain-containing protein YqiC